MRVISILKDGTIVKDLTGHVVSMKDCPMVYELITNINNPKSHSPYINTTSQKRLNRKEV